MLRIRVASCHGVPGWRSTARGQDISRKHCQSLRRIHTSPWIDSIGPLACSPASREISSTELSKVSKLGDATEGILKQTGVTGRSGLAFIRLDMSRYKDLCGVSDTTRQKVSFRKMLGRTRCRTSKCMLNTLVTSTTEEFSPYASDIALVTASSCCRVLVNPSLMALSSSASRTWAN